MPQYREPLGLRILEMCWDILRPHPDQSGREHWIDRVFYRGDDDVARPLSSIWQDEPPWALNAATGLLQALAATKPDLALLLREKGRGLPVSRLAQAAWNRRAAATSMRGRGLAEWQQRAHDDLSRMPPEDMALSVALGVVFGVFPAPACPTLLCAAAALVLRLNPSAIQAVNYLVSPLQVALLAPLFRLGGRLFQGSSGHAAAEGSLPILHSAAWRAAQGVLAASAHAMAGWFCICAPLGFLLYGLLVSVLRRRCSPPAHPIS